MKRHLFFFLIRIIDAIILPLTYNIHTHKILLAPGIESWRWLGGRVRAWHTFEVAAKNVPAYRAFLKERGVADKLYIPSSTPIAEGFATLPEMDKDSYIKRWSIPERSFGGKLPRRGVVVDESSGSSGQPTSWVRGPEERAATRNLLQVGFDRSSANLKKQPFVLNAFSLGAWATGMNVTASLTEVTMIKSVGPDKNKIIATMKEFGTDYTYIIISYPPFLKALFEDDRLNWADYDIVAAFGGEGISENMRTHILKYARSVLGSYGASDLEINLGIETDYTVALRRAIASDPELSARLTKQSEYGVLPMVFQFNPFDYLIETNEAGELVVTIVRKQNINPRIRYNIHDRGHITRIRDVTPVLKELGHTEVIDEQFLDLPLLFHYGRSDMSVDFNGAVVGPDALRDVIYGDSKLLESVENHRLISYEDANGDRQLHIAIQFSGNAKNLGEFNEAEYREYILDQMRKMNGDFHNAILTSDDATLPTIAFYGYREGPFAKDGSKLKNEYVWQLAGGEIENWEVDLSHVAAK
jgi:phenylacetate-CoA ligase